MGYAILSAAVSRADSFKNESSFGRRAGEAMICSHRSSPAWASRNLAKSATSTRLASGNCSQNRIRSGSWERVKPRRHGDTEGNLILYEALSEQIIWRGY